MTIGFRPLGREDLRVLHEWLQREHVRRWWSEHRTYEEVVEHYLPAIEAREPTDLYAILLDEEPAGLIQTYPVAGYPEYGALIGIGEGVAGVDLFLADEESLGRGIGTAVLVQFLEEVVFADESTSACVADPDSENRASLRAFEKAGFHAVKEFRDPEDGSLHTLVRIERDFVAQSH